jgi:hypothetical protein
MSEFSKSISDAYFTPPSSVEFIHNILANAGWLEGSILEPCCGAGNLVKGLDNVTVWDLHQYDHPLDRVGNFLEQKPESFDLVLTNPPFGWLGGLACDILNHATLFTNHIAIILPQCFRKVQRIDRIDPFFHPVGDYNLPDETYLLPDGQRKYVRTCFQMWERRNHKRKKFGNTPYDEFFRQVPKDDAEYYLRTQGSTAGMILEGFAYPDGRPYNDNTGRWMRGSKELILQHDWTKIARFASGAPSIGLHDIAWGLRSQNTEEYLKHGIMYDLINGFYDEKTVSIESFL